LRLCLNRPIWSFISVAAVCLTGPGSTISFAQEEHPVVTKHEIEVNGKGLNYVAEAGRVAIRDVEAAEPHGFIFYVAYRVPSSGRARPVAFVWNGGPGANSALLHFRIAGPKRAEQDHLVDNPETWLTFTDLVFVDPVGTGFSRPAKSEYGSEFYGTLGDTASIAEFVRSWRLLHGVEDAPLYLIGESWGAPRAATVAYALEKRAIRVDGLVLISGGMSLNTEYCPPALRNALRVVEFSARALYYGKTAPELGKDRDAIQKAAEAWGRQTYAPALARLDGLSDDERTALITQLSRFTGLSADQIDRKTLSVTPRQFLTGLLKDQGKTLQTLDVRKTVGSEPTEPETTVSAAILRYLRHDLGYRTDLPYVGLENWQQGYSSTGKYPEDVNERWNYATATVTPEEMKAVMEEAARTGSGPPQVGPPLPATEEAVALNPRMKILVAAGLYDSYASCAVNEETSRHLPAPLQRAMKFKCYVGGHTMYFDPAARLELNRDIKDVIARTNLLAEP
jgi:carboxypeptidase C (cathepsin A)